MYYEKNAEAEKINNCKYLIIGRYVAYLIPCPYDKMYRAIKKVRNNFNDTKMSSYRNKWKI